MSELDAARAALRVERSKPVDPEEPMARWITSVGSVVEPMRIANAVSRVLREKGRLAKLRHHDHHDPGDEDVQR